MSEFFVSTQDKIGQSTISIFYAPNSDEGLVVPERVVYMEGRDGGRGEFIRFINNIGVSSTDIEIVDDIEPVTAAAAVAKIADFINTHEASAPSEFSESLPLELIEAIATSEAAAANGLIMVLDALKVNEPDSSKVELHTGQYL